MPEIKPALFVMHTRMAKLHQKSSFLCRFCKKNQFCISFGRKALAMLCHGFAQRDGIFAVSKDEKTDARRCCGSLCVRKLGEKGTTN